MAGYDDRLTNAMAELSVSDGRWKELGWDGNIRTRLTKIENDYESIFSWNIKQLTGVSQNLILNLVDKVRGKQEMILDIDGKDDEFNLNKFYLQLIVCYELYHSKSYKESYLEIERVVKFMETCKFDESNELYSNAYHHIARATNAYVALALKIDSEKFLKDVKQTNNFNRAEKAAICAVKAKIFMEYPPKGNDIALEFAYRACNLNSTEPEWILIWLRAKGRVRRFYEPFQMPGNDEIDAANVLCSTTSKSHILIEASQIYKEAGYVHGIKNNQNESKHFYKLTSDITKKSIELAKDDIKKLYFILIKCIDNPKDLSQSIIDDLLIKLSNVENSCVDQVLGLYYLRHKKDYVKAKIHFSRGKAAGQFNSALQLIKVECLLQPVNTFPYVHTLNMMYDDFPSPFRRIIILLHILIYYNYYEKNPKEMMRYLKLYVDQDIDDSIKKRHLIFCRPLLNNIFFKPNALLNVLSANLKELMNYEWSIEEKMTIDYTFDRFNKILKLNNSDNNENTVKKINTSWRKQRVDLSEKKSNENHQHQSTSKYINQYEFDCKKHVTPDKEPSTSQNKIIDKHFKLPVIKHIGEMNDSNGDEKNLKKFENKFSSFGNIHAVSFENGPINKPSDKSRTRGSWTRGSNTRLRSTNVNSTRVSLTNVNSTRGSNTNVNSTRGNNTNVNNTRGSNTNVNSTRGTNTHFRSTRGTLSRGRSSRGRSNRHGSYKPIEQNQQDDSQNEGEFYNISDLWD